MKNYRFGDEVANKFDIAVRGIRMTSPDTYAFSVAASWELERNDDMSVGWDEGMWDEFYRELEREWLDGGKYV